MSFKIYLQGFHARKWKFQSEKSQLKKLCHRLSDKDLTVESERMVEFRTQFVNSGLFCSLRRNFFLQNLWANKQNEQVHPM